MNTHLYYCNEWLPNVPLEKWLWSPQQAEHAHKTQMLYNVLYNNPLKPTWRIEIAKRHAAYFRIDQFKRTPKSYFFSEVSPGVLFLDGIRRITYVDDTDTKERALFLKFEEDGNVTAFDQILHPFSERAHREAKSTADISSNYLAFPKFGHYTGILEFVATWPTVPLLDDMK
jgi:hypothetical protein